MPKKETLRKCWNKNPDGAGFMFLREDGMIEIKKGYMEFEDFRKALNKHKFKKGDTVVLHFRLSTGGGVTPENTHPFPLSDDISELQALHTITDAAMVHNGVIGDSDGNLSDTGVFVRDCLAKDCVRDNLTDAGIQNLLSRAIDSDRILILDNRNNLNLKFGRWSYKDGLYFSNLHWQNFILPPVAFQDNMMDCPKCQIELIEIGQGEFYCDFCNKTYVETNKGEIHPMPIEWLGQEVHKDCPDCRDPLEYSAFTEDYYCHVPHG